MKKFLISLFLGTAVITGTAVFAYSEIKPEAMQLHFVEDAEERQAVCNDGSPAAYYLREGSGENKNNWIIQLEGGASCSSEYDCKNRWVTQNSLMTSNGLTRQKPSSGILSGWRFQNPDFHNYNHVKLEYCSSDLWSGNNQIGYKNLPLQFRGKVIVDSVIEDLEMHGLKKAENILFSGSSAGGYGMMRNLDDISKQLTWADVRGINDSAWSMTYEIGPYNTSFYEDKYGDDFTSIEEDNESAGEYIHGIWNEFLDESCVANFPDTPWDCNNTTKTSEYIETPYFLYVDQQDHKHTERLGLTDFTDPEQKEYLKLYSEIMRESFEGIDAMFSTDRTVHTGLTSSRFNSLIVDGYTYRDIFTNWYFDQTGPKKVIESVGN